MNSNRIFNVTLFILLAINTCLFAQEDYKMEINGQVKDIALDIDYEVKIDNEIVNVRISLKDTLTYKDDMFSFKYPKEYKIATTNIEGGIEQMMLMTAEGSGFMIQKYSTFNPTMLNELMLSEVTKESLNYGFDMKRQDYERKLKSGEGLKVCKAHLTYKDQVNIYEIASIGEKDEGILIMTMEMDDVPNSEGKRLINMIWNTLEMQ